MRYQARVFEFDEDGKKKSKLVNLNSELLDDAREECDALTQVPFAAPEFVVKAEHPAAERKAVLKVMRSKEWDRMDDDEAAEAIIKAVNEVREETKRFAIVASLRWPGIDQYHLFVAGPFDTALQAERVGEAFVTDPATQHGSGRWQLAQVIPPLTPTQTAKKAWEIVKPKPCCSLHHGRVRDEVGAWQWITAGPDTEHWTEKVGW